MANLTQLILKPLISEKASIKTDSENRFGFYVVPKANKNQIKLAIEKLYNVKVLNVKTCITPGKLKKVGKATVRTPKTKKAYVQLSEGQKIEFFKGI